MRQFQEINPSPRTLMTPGPVEADPRVLRAMSAHILGQFDQMCIRDRHRGEFDGAAVYLNLRTRDVSKTGDLIEHGHAAGVDYSKSARDATAELGKEVCDAVVDYVLKFID